MVTDGGWPAHHPPRAIVARRSRSGSATRSMPVIRPPAMVKANTTRGRPPGAQTALAAPSTSAGRANRARPENVSATAGAPRTSAADPAGQLAGRGLGAAEDGRDLLEGHGEQVVEDEGQPLGRGQGLQHDQQRRPDRVGEQRLPLGVAAALAACQLVG